MKASHFNKPFFIIQDTEALKVLISLGISLDPRDSQQNPVRCLSMGIFKHHPTHWLFVARADGFEEHSENGHAVVGLGKHCCPPDQVDVISIKVAHQMFGETKGLRIREIELDPGKS